MKKLAMVLAVAAAACSSSNDNDKIPTPSVGGPCEVNAATDCDGTLVIVCDGTTWQAGSQDCASYGLVCIDGECDTGGGGPKIGDTCTQAYSTDCDGARIIVCDGSNWLLGFDCASDGEVCSPNGTCVGADAGTEFEYCDATRSVPCEGAMVCEQSTVLRGALCLQDCTADGTLCDEIDDGNGGTVSGYCDGTSALVDTSTTSVCSTVHSRNAPCYAGAPAEACAGVADCFWNGIGGINTGSVFVQTSFECDVACDAATVNNGQGTCSTGEECLAGPILERQGSAPAYVPCTALGSSASPCDAGGQYVCTGPASGDKFCARPVGRCGTPAPLQTTAGDFTDADSDDTPDWFDAVADAEFESGGAMCNRPGSDAYCAPAADGTATVECASMGYWYSAYSYQTNPGQSPATYDTWSCFSDLDCIGMSGPSVSIPASRCIGDTATAAGQCGSSWKSCVAFCDDPAGGDFSCPSLAPNCVAQDPTSPVDRLGPQTYQRTTTGESIECTTAGTQDNCADGHICTNTGKVNSVEEFYCMKPLRKICTE